jgi:hypothetical protein
MDAAAALKTLESIVRQKAGGSAAAPAAQNFGARKSG